MDQKFLKRLISECPLTDFSQNGNVTERELQLDKYLEQFTSFLYANENQLIKHFWQEYIASSEIVLLQNSEMLRRCFIFLDCAAAIYNYTAIRSKGKKNSQIAEHIFVQLQNDLYQHKSILLLAMNGCFNSVIVEYRSLYESFVIGQYLVQNPDLVPVYKDHLQFLNKYSSSYVHSSVFSVSTRTDLSQIKVFFHAAMHFIESEITDYLRESKLSAKDAVIMRNILFFLYQDFEKLEQS